MNLNHQMKIITCSSQNNVSVYDLIFNCYKIKHVLWHLHFFFRNNCFWGVTPHDILQYLCNRPRVLYWKTRILWYLRDVLLFEFFLHVYINKQWSVFLQIFCHIHCCSKTAGLDAHQGCNYLITNTVKTEKFSTSLLQSSVGMGIVKVLTVLLLLSILLIGPVL